MTDVVADAYATMADFRLFVRNAATTDATDADTTFELLALESAARAIEASCGYRTFRVAGTAAARYFTTRWDDRRSRYVCDTDDTFDVTGIEVAFDTTGDGDWGTAITTGFRQTPLNASDRGRPYTGLIFDTDTTVVAGKDRTKVTLSWGWTAIPNTIRNANLVQAARFLKRRDAVFGVAGSPDMGNELRLLAKVDPDVAVMLTPFRRYV